MDESPLISVIIPTHNEAPTLEVAVRSIMEQTYKNLEIIVADDWSTDATQQIIKTLVKEDPRIRYIRTPTENQNKTDWRGTNISVGYDVRNYAMESSRGDWITFQDADDASLLNRVAVQLSLALKYNATLITTGWLPLREDYLRKKLDTTKFEKDFPEPSASPKTIAAIAVEAKGLLSGNGLLNQYIPFEIKKRLLRPLFWGNLKPYPGADNSMFFKKEVIQKVSFRSRNTRVWPALSGRGVGRDFVFQVAETFQNSFSFLHPLYLWRIRDIPTDSDAFSRYLI